MRVVTNKFFSLEVRFLLSIIIAVVFIIVDGRFNTFYQYRGYIEDYIYLFSDLFRQSSSVLMHISNFLERYTKLIAENEVLRKELFLIKSELLLLDQYRKENCRLYELLHSSLYCNKRKMIARVLFYNIDLYNHQMIINQGSNNSVYIGQPVITDVGVVGQVIAVNTYHSRVLLISDSTHALSVQIKRNDDMCIILAGKGYNTALYSEYLGDIDVCIGDILVTSGLDGRFPAGYPVAIVSNVEKNIQQDITIIRATPIVKLQCVRDIILIWE